MFGFVGKSAFSGQSRGFGEYFPTWIREMFLGKPVSKLLTLEEALNSPASATKRNRFIDVELPDSFLLSRQLSSPPRSRGNWYSFAELDLIRQTPFKPDQVCWVLTDREKDGERELTQWIAKRSDLESITQRLTAKGITPIRFFFRAGFTLELLFQRQGTRAGSHRIWPLLNSLLVIGTVLSLGFAWLAPAWEAKVRADVLETEVASLQQEALSLRTELSDIRGIDAERTAFLDSLARNPRVVTQLRESTVVLPDNAWLNEWRYFRGQLRLSGEIEGSAAELVLLISEKSARWAPALAGAVSRTPEGKERFDIDIAMGRSAN